MLSSEQIQRINQQLDDMPTSWNTKRKRGYRRELNKQLREHHYASSLPLFQPTDYELIFINRITSIETLTQLNQQINQTKIFTMDTESINKKFQPNIPTLIQIQMCFETMSKILIVEAHHLPKKNQQEFNLIRNLFTSLLKRDKQLFIWGDVNELEPFISFGLFDKQQISRSNHRNIQFEFKRYWEQRYPHDPKLTRVAMQKCFGINHDNAIALQDAVAFQLDQYLNKNSSREAFDIGLDKKLKCSRLNPEEIEYIERLANYAADDCDAIYQLIVKSNLINDYYGDYDCSINDIDSTDEMIVEEQTRTSTTEQEQQIAADIPHANTATVKWENPLSKEERMKIHNRSRSRHQRIKAYDQEFIIHNIDKRFPVRIMKKILKEHGIPITRIHPTESKRTKETILFVGLQKPISTNKYNGVKNLFTREHYQRNIPKQLQMQIKPTQRKSSINNVRTSNTHISIWSRRTSTTIIKTVFSLFLSLSLSFN